MSEDFGYLSIALDTLQIITSIKGHPRASSCEQKMGCFVFRANSVRSIQ